MALRLLDHPLVAHLMTRLRNRDTGPEEFRRLARTLSQLLVIEATRQMRSSSVTVNTPLESTEGEQLAQTLALVPILRAGLGMMEAAAEMFPKVSIGYIGLERHESTAVAHSYYCKLPDLADAFTLCLDPMLATGGSASQALSLVRAHGAKSVVMVSVVAAPEGVAKLERDHPDIEIVAAALDRTLDARKFILPGLGDFGDRLYGTP